MMPQLIPARNVVQNAKQEQWRRRTQGLWLSTITMLGEGFRAGSITAEDMTPAQREAVQEWLLAHPATEHKRREG